MEIREATDDDIEAIHHVARESLLASYTPALSEEVIEEAVDNWYGDEFSDELDDDEALVLVGVEDGEVVAFTESYLTQLENQTGEINWLHVDPDHRGRGFGSKLLTETETRLVDEGIVRLKGKVLEANESGPEFYESHGYERGNDREVEIGDDSFIEWSFLKVPGDEETVGAAPLDPRELDDGRTVYVAYDEADRGNQGPFFVVYMDENREERYGYFCGHCEGFDIAMDAMGRVECNNCENKRKPTRWDASYL